jgi:hypothetical protein
MSLRKLAGLALGIVAYCGFVYWQGSQNVEAVNACKGQAAVEACKEINNLGM